MLGNTKSLIFKFQFINENINGNKLVKDIRNKERYRSKIDRSEKQKDFLKEIVKKKCPGDRY